MIYEVGQCPEDRFVSDQVEVVEHYRKIALEPISDVNEGGQDVVRLRIDPAEKET
jgi:hypothetical protein